MKAQYAPAGDESAAELPHADAARPYREAKAVGARSGWSVATALELANL
jgi:hypothetical protein